MSTERSEKFKVYQKEYNQRPEVKKHRIEYATAYYSIPENRENILKYHKEYNSRPEVKERHKDYARRYRSSAEGKATILASRCKRQLKEHRLIMCNDPERLTTAFLSKLIGCKCSKKQKAGE